MRLINVKSYKLKEFQGVGIPPYAILSHRWEEDEVSFREWKNVDRATKLGFRKIQIACEQARIDGHDWLWVDTSCIDKTSSAELSEAINSMFAWYAEAETCYAFLSDVPTAHDKLNVLRQFRESKWFTRGWTLQELLAPKKVIFYASDGSKIGSRGRSMTKDITRATGIDEEYLIGNTSIEAASVAKKMSWISRRVTTRPEDLAYCMLGIFDINMPLLYGEGRKAFTRLQEEIIKVSNDQTIFCWEWNETVPEEWTSILAPSPVVFQHCGDMVQKKGLVDTNSREVSTYQMTNAGLSIRLPTLITMTGYIVALDVTLGHKDPDSWALDRGRAWIPVNGEDRHGTLHVARVPYPANPIILEDSLYRITSQRTLIVKRKKDEGEFAASQIKRGRKRRSTYNAYTTASAFPRTTSPHPLDGRFGVYPAFQTSGLRDSWMMGCNMENSFNLGKNVMWLDSEHSRSRDVRSLVVHTKIRGTMGTAIGEWQGAQATVWLGAEVARNGEYLVDYGWSCRVLPRDDRQRTGSLKRKMEKHVLQEALREELHIHRELNLRVGLGAHIHGLGEGRIRFVALWRDRPPKHRTSDDQAEYSDMESLLSDSAVAVHTESE